MFGFDKRDAQRFLVSAIGALAVASTCIFAAVGPARATTAQHIIPLAGVQKGAGIQTAVR